MQFKLLPTLWLAGGILYAGSTVFLAHAVLGGPGGKQGAVAASGAQCQKDSTASVEADPSKTAAIAPDKAEEAKPQDQAAKDQAAKDQAAKDQAAKEPSPSKSDAAKPEESEQAAVPAPDGNDADQDQGGEQDQAALDQRGPDQSGAGQDQAGSQPDAANEGEGEWAKVIAGTADMRSDPSLQSQLVYALPAGWQVRVISRQAGWVQVQDANSGASGWVEASAIAPLQAPSGQQYGSQGPGPGYSQGPGYGPSFPPPPPGYGYPGRYAEEGYPEDPRMRRRERRGEFSDFLRRALGGF